VITMKNVVPVLWPLGTHLVLHGSHNDSKITLLQHSDESNCEFSTSIYYQAEGQRTIVRFLLVHTCKAVVVGEIMTVSCSQCSDASMEWCAMEYTIEQ
jgi:hypothetical protein